MGESKFLTNTVARTTALQNLWFLQQKMEKLQIGYRPIRHTKNQKPKN